MEALGERKGLERRIRLLLLGFIIGLVLSGVTAFPLPWEVGLLAKWSGAQIGAPGLSGWIARVNEGLIATDARFPFLAYGTDWLAFAHLVIATAFVGPLRDPMRNIWVIEWGIIACVAVIPLALIAGPIRGIPFPWQLIDASFGIVGFGPLLLCHRMIRRLERIPMVGQALSTPN
ncbi:hypothetical protein EON81_30350 [bacterium]|nr:MAG: hypothetical protein EON81_30350 [bacterium]